MATVKVLVIGAGGGGGAVVGGGGGAGGYQASDAHAIVSQTTYPVIVGGGGLGGVGRTAGGPGGPGAPNAITGSLAYYAGGGGGGTAITAAPGGRGGGGNGGVSNPGSDGTASTGGGGGGGGYGGDEHGGAGGSGVVIVRYNTAEITAAGGSSATDGDYTVRTFTSSGTFQITAGSGNVAVLVVAGGGGGGRLGGGGGGGGLIFSDAVAKAVGSYTVTVGGGGAGSTSRGAKGSNGQDSVFDTVTAIGGGGGGSYTAGVQAGATGGSGGGGAGQGSGAGAVGTNGQGNAGGNGGGNYQWSGGGGGGVGPGQQGMWPKGVSGGDSSFDGVTATGGGGGGGYQQTAGLHGGSGGGGGPSSGAYGTGSQGNHGGTGYSTALGTAGGGGGSGAVGSDGAVGVGGGGGNGTANSISGTSVTYAGGGGGGVGSGVTAGSAGTGGGGAGSATTSGAAGTDGLGGGGGGGAYAGGDCPGGVGGDGIVIIAYETGSLAGVGGVITTSGAYTIHTFTRSGQFRAVIIEAAATLATWVVAIATAVATATVSASVTTSQWTAPAASAVSAISVSASATSAAWATAEGTGQAVQAAQPASATWQAAPATAAPGAVTTAASPAPATWTTLAATAVKITHADRLYIEVAGVDYGYGSALPDAIVLGDSVTIADHLGEMPNTASFIAWGWDPVEGMEVKIYLERKNDACQIFGGVILSVAHSYVGTMAHAQHQCSCIDYTWLLGRRKVNGRWLSTSATTIAEALVNGFSAGFTTAHVEADLPAVDEFTCTNEELPAALTRLAGRIGACWYIDYVKDVWFYVTDAASPPGALTLAHPSLTGLVVARDLSQVVTRVYVEGGGANALADAAAGDTELLVEHAAWYETGGGQVACGPQRITYAGKVDGGGGSLVGPGMTPSSAPGVAAKVGAGLGAGVYQYAYTHVTAAGESLPSPLAAVTTGVMAPPGSLATPSVEYGTSLGLGVFFYGLTFSTPDGETAPTRSSQVETTIVAPPSAIGPVSNAATGNGPTAAKTYSYCYTYKNPSTGFETSPSPVSNAVVSDGHYLKIDMTGITGKPYGWNIQWYRTEGDGATYKSWPLPEGGNAIVYDPWTDAQLGAAAPGTNATERAVVNLYSIPVGPPGTTARNIYRTEVNGAQLKLLYTFADNVAGYNYQDITPDGSLGANAPTIGTALTKQVTVTGIAVGPSGTISRNAYRTVVGGAQLKLVTTLANNTATTYADSTADGSLTTNAPTSDTSGLTQPSGQVLAGSTSLLLAGAGAFPSAGYAWASAGSQVIRYTSIVGNTLTGIPASGPGSIVASINYNSTVVVPSQLTGIPASGAGAILYATRKGDQVNLVAQVDDLPAQATLAALVGGDGIIEDYLRDNRLSHGESVARGTAQLALRKNVQVEVRYRSRDPLTKAGRTVAAAYAAPVNLTGPFLIQSVAISRFAANPDLYPTYTVQASSERFTFEQLLALLR
jgi:hypothetical protein